MLKENTDIVCSIIDYHFLCRYFKTLSTKRGQPPSCLFNIDCAPSNGKFKANIVIKFKAILSCR